MSGACRYVLICRIFPHFAAQRNCRIFIAAYELRVYIGTIEINDYHVWIGANAECPNEKWNGLIDDVRIYHRVLSKDEIGGHSKRRREDIVPLRKDIAAELQSFVAGKLPTVQVFKVPEKTADMLKADLDAVNIPYVDDEGHYADFHALRHSTGSLLAASGVHPKVVQSIMRHSDINLTMSRYTHIFRGQESEAVASMPDLSSPSKEAQETRATGADVMVADGAYKPAYKKLAKKPYSVCNHSSLIGTSDKDKITSNPTQTERSKSLKVAELGTKKEPMSSADTGSKSNAPVGIRTPNLRFRRPMLYPIELQAQHVVKTAVISIYWQSWFRRLQP